MSYVQQVNPYAEIPDVLREVGQGLRHAELEGVREKLPLDVVSDLDFWAEAKISEHLRRCFPEDTILSEESANRVAYADRIWVLDPLDGTVNRTSDIPYFAISLALLEHGTPSMGWIYDPIHNELFSARAGRGAFVNERRIHVVEEGVRGVALTSGLLQEMARVASEPLVELLTAGKLRNFGAQALHLAYVAAGRLHAAASMETRLWDNLAGALLVREAGGIYTDLHGRDPFPIGPGSPVLLGAADSCIAASASSHPVILEFLQALMVDP